MEEETLAMELLHELKKSSKRNFIIAVILLIALVFSNMAWLIYESTFETVTEEKSQETYFTDNSNVTQNLE